MNYINNISSQFSAASYLTPAMPCTELSWTCTGSLSLNVIMSTIFSIRQGSAALSLGTAMRISLGLAYSPLLVNAVETFVRSSYGLIKASPDLKWFAKHLPNTALSLFRGKSNAKLDQIRTERAFKAVMGKQLYHLLDSKHSVWTKASVEDISRWTAGVTEGNKEDLRKKGILSASQRINILKEIRRLAQAEQSFTGVYLPQRAEIASEIEKCKENKPPRTNADIKATKVRKSEIFRSFVWMGLSLGTGLLTSPNHIINLIKSRFTDQTSFAASVFNSTLASSTAACEEIAQNAGIISSLMGLGFNVLSSCLSQAVPLFYAWNIYSEHSTGGWRQSSAALNSYLALDALWFNALPISLFGGIAQTFGFLTTYDIQTAGKITMCAPLVATVALKGLGSLIMGKGIGGKIGGAIASGADTILGESTRKAGEEAMNMSTIYSGLGKGSDILRSVLERGWNCTMLSHLPEAAAT